MITKKKLTFSLAVDIGLADSFCLRRLRILGIIFLFLLFNSSIRQVQAVPQKASSTIEITNPLDIARNELIEIPFSKFVEEFSWLRGAPFKLINLATKAELPYQLEYRGNDKPINILVYVSIGPKGSLKLTAKNGKPASPERRTYARYVPERFDDFAWENDKVAFRMYGAALEGRDDNAWGIDVWSKRTTDLIVDKWYESGDYHADHGEGMDYYSVGNTLGAGDIGLYVKDSIYFTNNYKTWKVLDNGPLRSTFKLTYPARTVLNTTVTASKIISIDAGSQLNKIKAVFDHDGSSDFLVAVGIVKRDGKGSVLLSEKEGIMGYWEPQSAGNGTSGIGCIMPEGVKEMKVENKHLLSVASLSPENSFTYYSGACWDRAGEILSANGWIIYLSNFALRVNKPVAIKFI